MCVIHQIRPQMDRSRHAMACTDVCICEAARKALVRFGGAFESRYGRASRVKRNRARFSRARRDYYYFRSPSFAMIARYRVRSSRVRYFSSELRLLTIFSSPRRDE